MTIGKDIVTINKLYLFLKTHSKVHVLAPGCVKELDELAETFINERTKRQDILREAENFIDKIRSEEVSELFSSINIIFLTTLLILQEKENSKNLYITDEGCN